jgi:uncharacterized protein YkwD
VDRDREAVLWNRVNCERAAAGLPPLERDERLRDVARFHSADMAIGGFVSQSSPGEGKVTARAAQAVGIAENRVIAQVAAGSVADVTAALTKPGLSLAAVGIVDVDGRSYVTAVAVTNH